MDFAATQLWVTGLCFARIGAMLMLVPALGDVVVPTRVRLVIALFVAGLIAPQVANGLPAMPLNPWGMGAIMGHEILIGLALGFLTRLVMSTLATAGAIIGMQTGMGFAAAVDPAQGQQTPLFGTFMALLGTTMIFQTGLHGWFISGALTSYQHFPATGPMPFGPMAEQVLSEVSHSFLMAIQITAPFLLFGTVFNLAIGIINRAAPAIQVFFIAQPLQVLLGIALFMITLSAAMMVWIDGVTDLAHMLGTAPNHGAR